MINNTSRLSGIVVAVLVAVGAACQSHAGAGEADSVVEPAAVVGVVDSIFPIEEEIRRFRATLYEEPTRLGNTSATRDDLVARFVTAVETVDTAEFRRMVLTRPEFAMLYYPTTQFTSPPYELSPALVWYRQESYSSRGLTRVLNRFAGHPLHFSGYACEDEPMVQGENRLWHGCVVYTQPPGGERVALSLFGPILERQGEFKLLGYANRL